MNDKKIMFEIKPIGEGLHGDCLQRAIYLFEWYADKDGTPGNPYGDGFGVWW